MNPYEHCLTCGRKKRSRSMIYDVANDKMFCSEECERKRPDRKEQDGTNNNQD